VDVVEGLAVRLRSQRTHPTSTPPAIRSHPPGRPPAEHSPSLQQSHVKNPRPEQRTQPERQRRQGTHATVRSAIGGSWRVLFDGAQISRGRDVLRATIEILWRAESSTGGVGVVALVAVCVSSIAAHSHVPIVNIHLW